ncbi:protein SSUH2 homolog [Polyodon spathula]|uniref:protein SSUH2 homolog n=1 Tax=Polyodon spathula TaxID=7913 RepID=UPI001B7EAB9B|nr:protein SSUH2 homolog [Polyodon spathula]
MEKTDNCLRNALPKYDLDPSIYTIIPPPQEKKSKKTQKEEFSPSQFILLSDAQIRAALLDWVKRKSFRSPKAARNMILTGVSQVTAYYYILESFTECRAICNKYEPFNKNVCIDGPVEGEELSPWEVPVFPSEMFCSQVQYARIPHTDVLTQCPECKEKKWVPCKTCHASSKVRCQFCHGSGKSLNKKNCWACNGERLVACATCMALGRVCCEMCLGKGKVCYYKELRVEYKRNVCDYVHMKANIPRQLVPWAPGDVLYDSTAESVQALTTFPEEEVNKVSQELLRHASTAWPDCQIIQQRHILKSIPINHILYQWKNTSGSFFVYGSSNYVYFADYPQNKFLKCPLCF